MKKFQAIKILSIYIEVRRVFCEFEINFTVFQNLFFKYNHYNFDLNPACSSSFSNLPQRNHVSDSDNILEIVELERFSLPKNWFYSAFKNVGPYTSICTFLRFLGAKFSSQKSIFQNCLRARFLKKKSGQQKRISKTKWS